MQRKIISIESKNETVEIPYYIFGDAGSAKSIFFTGGTHGDEVNGVLSAKITLDIVSGYEQEGVLDGKVIVIPVMNPPGFEQGKRVVPIDGNDLNRSFGKTNHEPTISTSMADALTNEVFTKCNLGVDYHDAGEGSILLPHVRIHIDDEHDCVSCSRELGGYFGAKYLLERRGNPHMLAVALKKNHNIPVITVEMGGDQVVEPDVEETVTRGVKNMLIAAGMLEGEPELPKDTYVINKRVILQSKFGGVLDLHTDIGEKVIEGEEIGTVYDPLNDRTLVIKSPKQGMIFSRWPNNLVPKGRTIVSLVCFEGDDFTTPVDMPAFSVKPYLI